MALPVYQRYFNAMITTNVNHNLTTGDVIRIQNAPVGLNSINFYVRVIDNTRFTLYYDKELRQPIGPNNTWFDSSLVFTVLSGAQTLDPQYFKLTWINNNGDIVAWNSTLYENIFWSQI